MSLQVQTSLLDMDEITDQEFTSEFAELSKLCGFFDTEPVAAAGEVKPSKPAQIKLSTSSPPMRYVRRSKTQMSKDDRVLFLSNALPMSKDAEALSFDLSFKDALPGQTRVVIPK